MEQDKKLVEKVLDDICELDKKIGDIGKDNIISHSSLDEASEMVKGIDKEINNIKGINRKRTAIPEIVFIQNNSIPLIYSTRKV